MKQSQNKDNTCKRNNNQPLLIRPSTSVDGRGRGQGIYGGKTLGGGCGPPPPFLHLEVPMNPPIHQHINHQFGQHLE